MHQARTEKPGRVLVSLVQLALPLALAAGDVAPYNVTP